MKQILLAEGVHPSAKQEFERAGWRCRDFEFALSESELLAALQGVSALGLRSKTIVPARIIHEAKDLRMIAAFCVGTDHIAIEAANERKIPVFNSRYGNTRSVAEMVLAELILLARRISELNSKMHQGKWERSEKRSHDVLGKTLGIVGYGSIGSQLSVLAEALGFRVIYYDILPKQSLGRALPCKSLDELLALSDFVTLHVPATALTRGMMGERQFFLMKHGSYFVNASRGTVVDIPALKAALDVGRVAAAALDVYPDEPVLAKAEYLTVFAGMSQVVLTPHIAGATEEAFQRIAQEVTTLMLRYDADQDYSQAVNAEAIKS